MPPSRDVRIQSEDFNLGAIYAELVEQCAGKAGAVVTFVGLVRDHHKTDHDNTEVASLTLEHYPGMTERSIEAIVTKAEQEWPLLASCIIHRVGQLQPADQIVLVAVASEHRGAAFAAAEFVMDYLKTDAVIWKREAGLATTRWIQSSEADLVRQQRWQDKPDVAITRE